MPHHRWLHAGGIVLVLAVVLAALQNIYPQAPIVDLRLMLPKSIPLAQPASPTPALVDSVCQFIALRGVLDDLQIRIHYLQTETMFLERDANSLWSGWKSVFGVQRAFFQWNIAAASVAVTDGSFEQRFQAEVFALYGKGRRISESTQGLTSKLQKADERWRTISRLLATSNSDDASRGVDGINALRTSLSKFADEVNILDDDVRRGQGELDRLYPQMLHLLQRDAPNAIALSQPWHWTYMVSDKLRPTLQYDFDLRYDQELENARRDIDNRAVQRRRGQSAESWRTVPVTAVPKATTPTRASGSRPQP